ncbi:tRNA-binding protein [Morganella morganii]|nr:tRNA-binding protein [Morganella morganii]
MNGPDFEKVELRVGVVLTAELNPKARKPAYIFTVDFGEYGVKTSSAQVTALYKPEELIGRQVLCVCNFAPETGGRREIRSADNRRC